MRRVMGMDVVTAFLFGIVEGAVVGLLFSLLFRDWNLMAWGVGVFAGQRALSCVLDNALSSRVDRHLRRPVLSVALQWAAYGLVTGVAAMPQGSYRWLWVAVQAVVLAALGAGATVFDNARKEHREDSGIQSDGDIAARA